MRPVLGFQKHSLFQFLSKIHCLVLMSGMAALSWEVMWQIKSTLALGVSAWGTALTLAVTMGGMCAGAVLMGYVLRKQKSVRPVRIYAGLECAVGISGLFLGMAFRAVESLDTHAYAVNPGGAAITHLLGIAAVLSIPTLCMGATLPVMGLMARQFKTSIAVLYGFNTLGAAAGTLVAAFALIPLFGVSTVILMIATINILVGILAWRIDDGAVEIAVPEEKKPERQTTFLPSTEIILVAVTGFSTFMLEVAWFRSLTAAFMSTTDAFAIMLASVLLALGLGSAFVPILKRRTIALGVLLGWAGILILFVTPVIERFDLFTSKMASFPLVVFLQWFALTFYVVGAPVLLLGVALPWILDDQDKPRRWGALYGTNALFAIIGSVCAGWIFLPMIGFAGTAWLTGILVACAGIAIAPREKRKVLGIYCVTALLVAVVFQSGVGKTRVQGQSNYGAALKVKTILESYEGPEATVSAIEYDTGLRAVIIDGFVATQQSGQSDKKKMEHYMAWMGHMPMILHPDPENALVICFGTGQTANAVRRENAVSVDIVDINKNIFKLAHNFSANEAVLDDPRVKTIVMDGRAYVRRTNKVYDVITLEPMPPNFAGVNALYSIEFYQHAREKMSKNGVIAQWLPFHLVAPHYSASIAKTFQTVFPNAILWIDSQSSTGILLGSANDDGNLGADWPGFERLGIVRDMSKDEVRKLVLLDRDEMQEYGTFGEIINDDNQLLSYGRAAHLLRSAKNYTKENYDILNGIADTPFERPAAMTPKKD